MVSQCQIVGNIKKWIVADVNASLESENGSGYSGGGVMWRWSDDKNNELTHNNQNQDFFPRPNSPKSIPKPSKNWQKSPDQDQNQDFSISLTIFKEIFSKYFPSFPSLFFFSSRKKIFSFSEYFPSFSSPPEQSVNSTVNVAVFSFLHLHNR